MDCRVEATPVPKTGTRITDVMERKQRRPSEEGEIIPGDPLLEDVGENLDDDGQQQRLKLTKLTEYQWNFAKDLHLFHHSLRTGD